jgi:hypothetical protein
MQAIAHYCARIALNLLYLFVKITFGSDRKTESAAVIAPEKPFPAMTFRGTSAYIAVRLVLGGSSYLPAPLAKVLGTERSSASPCSYKESARESTFACASLAGGVRFAAEPIFGYSADYVQSPISIFARLLLVQPGAPSPPTGIGTRSRRAGGECIDRYHL